MVGVDEYKYFGRVQAVAFLGVDEGQADRNDNVDL